MDVFRFDEDIEVVYLQVPNFPADVPSMYEKLQSFLPENANRRYFGISHPDETGKIQYKAAAEILPTDRFDNSILLEFVIKKGNFAAKYIVNHFQDSNCIGDAFQELLKHPKLDLTGYCLEFYKNYTDLDVHCMVRLTE